MRETTLHGQTMRVGDKVALAFGSGNRDWRKFPDPDVYDIERRPQGHLGFGAGKHFCLGSQMARLVTEVAMKRFLERVPDYHLWPMPTIAWNSSSNFRSPVALPFVNGLIEQYFQSRFRIVPAGSLTFLCVAAWHCAPHISGIETSSIWSCEHEDAYRSCSARDRDRLARACASRPSARSSDQRRHRAATSISAPTRMPKSGLICSVNPDPERRLLISRSAGPLKAPGHGPGLLCPSNYATRNVTKLTYRLRRPSTFEHRGTRT